MNYKHLTTFERNKIEVLNKLGYSTRKIVKEINRHHSTVARELSRNQKSLYNCELAEANYHIRRKASKYIGKLNLNLISNIESAIEATWSPEQIANTITKNKLSFKTIYRWIRLGYIANGDLSKLRQKGKRRKPIETEVNF